MRSSSWAAPKPTPAARRDCVAMDALADYILALAQNRPSAASPGRHIAPHGSPKLFRRSQAARSINTSGWRRARQAVMPAAARGLRFIGKIGPEAVSLPPRAI